MTTHPLLLALLLSLPALAMAQEPDYFDRTLSQAKAAFKARHYNEALKILDEAGPKFKGSEHEQAWQFGRAEVFKKMRRIDDAVAALEALAAQTEGRTKIETKLKKLKAAYPAALEVRCDAPGAQVEVPGLSPARKPCPALWGHVASGRYKIIARKGDFNASAQQQLTKGKTEVSLNFDGRLLVQVQGAAYSEIYLDGKLGGKAPYTSPDLPIGEHTVEVRTDEQAPRKITVMLKPAELRQIKFDLSKPPLGVAKAGTSPWVWVGVGAGVLAVGLTTGLLMQEPETERVQGMKLAF